MTANAGLVLFLVAFWGLFVAVVKVSNRRAGKRWGDGPSLFPAILPVIPAAAAQAGWLVNRAGSPRGTWAVVGLHVGWLAVSLAILRRHPPDGPTQRRRTLRRTRPLRPKMICYAALAGRRGGESRGRRPTHGQPARSTQP